MIHVAELACAHVIVLLLPVFTVTAYNDWQNEALRILAQINGTTHDNISIQGKYLEIIGALELDKPVAGCGISGARDMLGARPATRRHSLLALFGTPLHPVAMG